MNFKKFSYLLTLRTSAVVAQALFFFLVFQKSGTTQAGSVALFLATLSVFRGVAPLGFDVETLRLSSVTYDGTIDQSLVKLALVKSFWLTLIGSVITLFVSLLSPSSSLTIALAALAAAPLVTISISISLLRPTSIFLKSQKLDTFFTSFLPLVISSTLLFTDRLSVFWLSLVFLLANSAGAAILVKECTNRARVRISPTTSINSGFFQNGVAQALINFNTRFPTVISGLLGGLNLTAFVDLGSKTQLFSGTLAWIFGAVYSPDYARDFGLKRKKNYRKVLLASLVCACGTAAPMATIVLFSGSLAPIFSMTRLDFENLMIWFTLIALLQIFPANFGYLASMSKKYYLVSFGVILEMLVTLLVLVITGSSLKSFCFALACGSLSRMLLTCFFALKMYRKAI